MLLTLVLAAAAQPAAAKTSLPLTPACEARTQAARDQHAISRLRYGKYPHQVSVAFQEYVDLSDRLADAIREPRPDMAKIRAMSQDLAGRRVSIEGREALTKTECHLDMVERSLPTLRQLALNLITPPTKARREAALSTLPSGPFIGDPPKTLACDAMRQAVHDQWALVAGTDAHPASSSVSEYLKLRDRLADLMQASNPDLVLARAMHRDLENLRLNINMKAALSESDCTLDRVQSLPLSDQRSELLRMAPPTKAERENPKIAPPPGPYIQGSTPYKPGPRQENSTGAGVMPSGGGSVPGPRPNL